MIHGNVVFTLHTHLPYVLHHGEWPHGTDWLCEAVAECYIPLLNVMHDLLWEGITPRVSFDISPVLCEQLEHPDFWEVFITYCDTKSAAAAHDKEVFLNDPKERHFAPTAQYWSDWYAARKNDFIERYKGSIVNGFKELQDRGAIEILTCGATHGYFALLGSENSIALQIKSARANYAKFFGRLPRGMWIPECAYRPSYHWKTYLPVDHLNTPRLRPGIERFLAAEGIEFFFVDQHAIKQGRPHGILIRQNEQEYLLSVRSPEYIHFPGNFARTPHYLYNVSSTGNINEGMSVAFSRHQDIAMQVWSGERGYPGDGDYLEFHKKHYRSAMKYWRITDNKSDMLYKQPYVPEWTQHKVQQHAQHFVSCIEGEIRHIYSQNKRHVTLCLPFDTELFGHWWFEGPEFLRYVLKGLHNSSVVNTATASEQLDRVRPHEVMAIPESSWGRNGNHDVWMNEGTKWTWQAIYNAERRFDILLRNKQSELTPLVRRVLTQALRELLLLQASDWQFLIDTQSAKDYAERRFVCHFSDFSYLCDLAARLTPESTLSVDEEQFISETESRNALFPELKLEWWIASAADDIHRMAGQAEDYALYRTEQFNKFMERWNAALQAKEESGMLVEVEVEPTEQEIKQVAPKRGRKPSGTATVEKNVQPAKKAAAVPKSTKKGASKTADKPMAKPRGKKKSE